MRSNIQNWKLSVVSMKWENSFLMIKVIHDDCYCVIHFNWIKESLCMEMELSGKLIGLYHDDSYCVIHFNWIRNHFVWRLSCQEDWSVSIHSVGIELSVCLTTWWSLCRYYLCQLYRQLDVQLICIEFSCCLICWYS